MDVYRIPSKIKDACDVYKKKYALMTEYNKLLSYYDEAISKMQGFANDIEREVEYARKAAFYKHAIDIMKKETGGVNGVHTWSKKELLQDELAMLLEYLAFDEPCDNQ